MSSNANHDHAVESDDDLDGCCDESLVDEDLTPDEDLPAAEGGVA